MALNLRNTFSILVLVADVILWTWKKKYSIHLAISVYMYILDALNSDRTAITLVERNPVFCHFFRHFLYKLLHVWHVFCKSSYFIISETGNINITQYYVILCNNRCYYYETPFHTGPCEKPRGFHNNSIYYYIILHNIT